MTSILSTLEEKIIKAIDLIFDFIYVGIIVVGIYIIGKISKHYLPHEIPYIFLINALPWIDVTAALVLIPGIVGESLLKHFGLLEFLKDVLRSKIKTKNEKGE